MSTIVEPSGLHRTGFPGAASAALALRKIAVLAATALIWELAARWVDDPLLFPTFSASAQAFIEAIAREGLAASAAVSLRILLEGYALGLIAAALLAGLAVLSTAVREAVTTLASMLSPLPAIALLPLAMLWFGLGEASLIFVLVHAVVWPLAVAMLGGFEAVPATLRMAGRNWGLSGAAFVWHLLLPAALPAVLSGLRIGWAFAWRTLIAAELVFGVSSGEGGLGWFIFQARNELYVDKVFAGLAAVVLIGFLVEALVFRTLEAVTVRRWGMMA